MDSKGLVDMLIQFVIFLVVSIIFMIIMLVILGFSAKLVFGGELGHYGAPALVAAGLIVGATVIGGGSMFKFKD